MKRKKNDKKYLVESLDGILSFRNDYRGCLKKKASIVQEIKKMMLDRNKYYSKSNFKIDCDNHKKNEIVDRIVSILKKNEIKS